MSQTCHSRKVSVTYNRNPSIVHIHILHTESTTLVEVPCNKLYAARKRHSYSCSTRSVTLAQVVDPLDSHTGASDYYHVILSDQQNPPHGVVDE